MVRLHNHLIALHQQIQLYQFDLVDTFSVVEILVVDADALCCSRVTCVLVDVGVSVFVTVVLLVDVVLDAAKALVDIAANTHATNKDFLVEFHKSSPLITQRSIHIKIYK